MNGKKTKICICSLVFIAFASAICAFNWSWINAGMHAKANISMPEGSSMEAYLEPVNPSLVQNMSPAPGKKDAVTRSVVLAGNLPSSVDALSGNINAYKSDGTTLLGKFLGTATVNVRSSASCDNIVYSSSSTYLPVFLSDRDCTESDSTWYYSGTGCTGSILNTMLANAYVTNYDQKAYSANSGAGYRTLSYASYRDASTGSCTDSSGSTSVDYSSTYCTSLSTRVCGTGQCQVK
jgi:hypothetical protein